MKLSQTAMVLCLVLFLGGCSSVTGKKESSLDYAKYTQKTEPLAENLSVEEEYEFVLDLAEMQVERQRYQRAEELLQKLRKENRQDIRLYRLLAKSYEGQKKYELALVAWQQVVKLEDKTLEDQASLARQALMNERYDLAETVYRGWLEAEKLAGQVSALNNLGFSALLQNEYQEAERYFQRALKKDPLNSKALNNLKLVKTLASDV